mmetsp:Transcript_50487/g.163589  ORF Transcript_50487/g.163589 Transcript_50487/m.163589 type:complete len:264 (-) Transcript_50487:189-980(-)
MKMLVAILATATGYHARAPARPAVAVRMAAKRGGGGKGFASKPQASAEGAQGGGSLLDAAGGQSAISEAEAAAARGRSALEAMRQAAGADPDEARRGRAALRQTAYTAEEMSPVDPSAGVMPEVVSNRMLSRVVPFAGLPVFGAFLVFVGAYYANTQLDLDVPPQVIAYATQACFALSFAGITWGVLSTSWDEETEGSLLGSEQVGRNVAMMRDGMARGRAAAEEENAEIEAADDGVLMSREMLERDKARRARKSDSKLPPIV